MNSQQLISLSQVIAMFLIVGVILLIYNLIPNVESTVYPMISSIIIVQIMIGFFILELKKKTPPLSDKLNRGKIDIKWGLIHFWMAFLWFKRID